jgi:hypothetical protein
MKKTTIATALAAVLILGSPKADAQSIDYGMVAATVQSPASTSLIGGGFQLMGVKPASGFNPTNATLASILDPANMLVVLNSFTTIDAGAPGQFYTAGLLPLWSDSSSIPSNTKLYILGSTSSSFSLTEPWTLVSGTDAGWLSPVTTDPTAMSIIEMSLGGNSLVAGSVGNYFSPNGPGTTVSPGDASVVLVPEPSTYALLSLAGLALGGYAARRRLRA